MHLSSEAYDVFEQVFQGKDNAKKVMRALEEAIVTTVHDSWYRTKEELKAEVFSHFATKDDLDLLRTELLGKMEKDKAELLGNIGTVYEKTEKDKVELLGKMEKDKTELLGRMEKDKAELLGRMEKDKAELLGRMEKDKAELLGKMEKDKTELVGMITNVHTELTGKFEALYEKTEKDKAELLGKIGAVYEKTEKDKAELSGKIEALYQKTEKDKAELSGKIEALFAKTEKDKAELNEKIENVKSEMLLRFEKMDKKFSLFFALLLFAIIFLNQNALEFIAKVIGIMK